MSGKAMCEIRSRAIATSLSILAGTFSMPVQAQDFWGKAVDAYFFDSRSCALFSLVGVTEADPVVPGAPYFALSKSNANYAEMNAVLLSAKAGNLQVNIKTSGATVCGQAEVVFVGLK